MAHVNRVLIKPWMNGQRLMRTKASGALHDELGMAVAKDSLEKMKSAALELVGDEVDMLDQLCQCVSSASVPRARHVASLARVIRKAGGAAKVVPLLEPWAGLAAYEGSVSVSTG